MDKRCYWVWMQHAFEAGSYKPWFIANRFSGGLEEFHKGGAALWNSLNYITEKESRILHSFSLEEAQIILELSERMRQQVITPECEKYPEALRNIFDPPAVIYVKGNMPEVDSIPAIGVVGTRKCTEEGSKAALTIGYQLALSGAVVISGGAVGVDTAAHKGALRAMGKSICVLPCGISDGYLIENYKLREQVASDGALLTEYPINTPVTRGTFQVRNRLISGLSCGTLVVEAAKRSGALITAKHAKEQSRDVFAYPGQPGDSHFEGCRGLIEDGAKAVTNGEMILEEYAFRFHPVSVISTIVPLQPTRSAVHSLTDSNQNESEAGEFSEEEGASTPPPSGLTCGNPSPTQRLEVGGLPSAHAELSEKARAVLETLSDGEKHISEIERDTGISSGQILSAITELELLGLIESHPGRKFSVIG